MRNSDIEGIQEADYGAKKGGITSPSNQNQPKDSVVYTNKFIETLVYQWQKLNWENKQWQQQSQTLLEGPSNTTAENTQNQLTRL